MTFISSTAIVFLMASIVAVTQRKPMKSSDFFGGCSLGFASTEVRYNSRDAPLTLYSALQPEYAALNADNIEFLRPRYA